MTDLISRADAMGAVQDHFNAYGFKGYYDGQQMMGGKRGRGMIQREYLTEYDEYSNGIKHSITISTDNYHVFKTIKAYAESVCEKEDSPKFCEDASEVEE